MEQQLLRGLYRCTLITLPTARKGQDAVQCSCMARWEIIGMVIPPDTVREAEAFLWSARLGTMALPFVRIDGDEMAWVPMDMHRYRH